MFLNDMINVMVMYCSCVALSTVSYFFDLFVLKSDVVIKCSMFHNVSWFQSMCVSFLFCQTFLEANLGIFCKECIVKNNIELISIVFLTKRSSVFLQK